MPRPSNMLKDQGLLEAALEGLILQKERIESQIREVRSLLGRRRASISGSSVESASQNGPRKRELSEAARKRIAAAQKKRWAEYRKQHKSE